MQPPFSCIHSTSFFVLCWTCRLHPIVLHSSLPFAIAHCNFARFHNLLLKMHNGIGSFGGSLLELCNANMASRLWSPGSCWTLLIKIVNYAIVHFHPWFIIHELFFHNWLQKCKFLSSSSLLITMVFLIMLWFWSSCAGIVVVIMMQL